MSNSDYEKRIEKIASLIVEDNLSLDEQDSDKLKKYHEFAKTNYSLDDEASIQLVFESLVYLKLKNAGSGDPMQEGDKFGVGFS